MHVAAACGDKIMSFKCGGFDGALAFRSFYFLASFHSFEHLIRIPFHTSKVQLFCAFWQEQQRVFCHAFL